MASQFTLPLTAEGAVTAPSGVFTFVKPSAQSQKFLDVGPANILELPEFGFAIADGVNPLRLITRGGVYNAGGVAPSTALTAAGTGNRATLVQTFTVATNPANNDEWTLVSSLGWSISIRTVTALTTTTDLAYGYYCEVKLGSGGTGAQNLAQTIQRVKDVINGSSNVVEGTDFHWRSIYATYAQTIERLAMTVSATTANTITYRTTVFGTVGNNGYGSEGIDGAATWAIGSGGFIEYFTGGTNSTGTAPNAGIYRYFYTWVRSTDNAETGRSPIASVNNGTPGNVSITGLTASADTTYDFIRVYRTQDLGTEFYPCKDLPRASSSFTDDLDDETLARAIAWNDLLFPTYNEGCPPRCLALAFWKGRLWSLGAHLAADYTRGTVSVTEGSATITFSVLGVTERMVRRTFKVAATNEEYNILSVSESAGTAVLDRVYEGTTNGTASFTIKDDYDASRLRATPEFLFNQWPEDESPGRVDTDDPRGGLALLATKSRLFAFSRTSIIAVTGSGPESWEISKVGQGVGCVAPRLVIGVEGGGIFLSLDGFYTISPDESMVCISSPKAPKKMLAVGIDGTVARINWANINTGYSYYDTTNRAVVFGLPLDGATVPNYEIVFDLQNGTWTTYKRAEWTDAAPITLPSGEQAILAGDREGYLWHAEIGESDGFYGTEPVQTLTGAQTVRALTVTGTPYSTSGDGEKGKPFIVLYADGVTVAYGKVGSNTSSVITPAEDLDTAPAAGDQIILGGIDAWARSGYPSFGEEYRKKLLKSVTLRHAPISRGTYFFSFAADNGSFTLPPVGTGIGSLSDTTGKVRHFTQWPGDTHAIQVRRFQPGGRMVIRGGVFELVLREAPTR